MHHRRYPIRVEAGVCRRLERLRRQTGTSIQKLVNSILRDYTDELSLTARCTVGTARARSWRRR